MVGGRLRLVNIGNHYARDQLTSMDHVSFKDIMYIFCAEQILKVPLSPRHGKWFDTFHWDLFRVTTQCQDVSGRRIGWATECFFLVVFTCIEASRWDVLCWVCFVFCILLASQWRRRDSAESCWVSVCKLQATSGEDMRCHVPRNRGRTMAISRVSGDG